MLKWAVNQPRPSYLAKELPEGAATNPKTSAAATGATGAAGSGASSYSEFHAPAGESFKPTSAISCPRACCTRTPTPTPTLRPPAYASTLPTFEAEYSPSAAIIPGPLLALRGMGIPDSYFEKPRYLEQKPLPLPLPLSVPVPQAPATKSGQTTLSSSQMGDVTLERMIDAILESTRKAPAPRQPRQRLRQRHRHHPLSSTTSSAAAAAAAATHSPTYRPAFDPASDLCEYWRSPHASGYEEREVRSPQPATVDGQSQSQSQSQGKRRSLQLRRQRVVRRKRKIATRISSSVRQSAQKLLAAARSAQKIRHISPDSGHNSTSDCDFEEEVDSLSSLGACGGLGLGMGLEAATKRRLSFSFQEDLFVEK
ncbi:GL16526 [Drosophila persimilis]|uniref:GL16526 n=1 Tax=Drosophila persimilis TaxID=7234 RepID=B4GWB9_DROPE|nr:GL16526 [Drosophila persimilis]